MGRFNIEVRPSSNIKILIFFIASMKLTGWRVATVKFLIFYLSIKDTICGELEGIAVKGKNHHTDYYGGERRGKEVIKDEGAGHSTSVALSPSSR